MITHGNAFLNFVLSHQSAGSFPLMLNIEYYSFKPVRKNNLKSTAGINPSTPKTFKPNALFANQVMSHGAVTCHYVTT